MPKIFISYRRSDSEDVAGRIYDRLLNHFGKGNVFKDVDDIPFGVDFRDYLNASLDQCQIVLAVIGKTWLTATDDSGRRRLDNPADWVRLELEESLRRRDVLVVPLLVRRASLPRVDELPEPLRDLAYRNGTQARPDPDFHTDMTRLINGVESYFKNLKRTASPPPPSPVPTPANPTFSFEVVTVDAQGKIVQRQPAQAEYRVEDLGGGIQLELVKIPSGRFQMGAPQSEDTSRDMERPQHWVTVPEFWMGKFPVTQAQYQAVMGKNPSHFTNDGANRPVEQVTWNDAVAFCQALSQRAGPAYRLPSEAEWEYACRAGTTTPFHFGPTMTTDLANYRGTDCINEGKTNPGNFGHGPMVIDREHTTVVGQFSPNAFGLYDLHGNVTEWCQDVWHGSYAGAPADGAAWLAGGDQDQRILRGGSWLDNPEFCRSAYRFKYAPGGRVSVIGFRVVCGLASGLS
ncbi:MAG: SUMF1/EgtB/PvdO family nonheme iron enzyme [Cyanobacteria bacterium P01_H01_bin.162]